MDLGKERVERLGGAADGGCGVGEDRTVILEPEIEAVDRLFGFGGDLAEVGVEESVGREGSGVGGLGEDSDRFFSHEAGGADGNFVVFVDGEARVVAEGELVGDFNFPLDRFGHRWHGSLFGTRDSFWRRTRSRRLCSLPRHRGPLP